VFVEATAETGEPLRVVRFQHETLGEGLTGHLGKKQPSGGNKDGRSIPIEA